MVDLKSMDFKSDHKARDYLDKNTTREKVERILLMSRKPIIIGGCGRSGTTLLLSILSCHPKIFCIGTETMAFCPDGFVGAEYNKNPNLKVPFETWKVFDYLIDSTIPGECTRWCEKTPRNVLYFGRILDYFGQDVKLIHIVRDGRDVITSRHPLAPDKFWAPPHRWIMDVSAGRRLQNHPQVFTVRYEDLLREYKKTVHQICDFIEEDFHADFLKYPETAKVQQSLAWPKSARPISAKSIGRWKNPAFAERIAVFLSDPAAVVLMRHYGYEVEVDAI